MLRLHIHVYVLAISNECRRKRLQTKGDEATAKTLMVV